MSTFRKICLFAFVIGTIIEASFATEQLSSLPEPSTQTSPSKKSTFEENAKKRRENRSNRQKQREANREDRENGRDDSRRARDQDSSNS